MRNVLRTMIALAESDRITVDDMVEDLFREAHSTAANQQFDQLPVEDEKLPAQAVRIDAELCAPSTHVSPYTPLSFRRDI